MSTSTTPDRDALYTGSLDIHRRIVALYVAMLVVLKTANEYIGLDLEAIPVHHGARI